MTVTLRDKDIAAIVAVGGVVVTRNDQRGTGEQAIYDAATEFITLTGSNAEVRDKEHGAVQGTRLIMKITGDTMAVESGNKDRAVTKRTVKKSTPK